MKNNIFAHLLSLDNSTNVLNSEDKKIAEVYERLNDLKVGRYIGGIILILYGFIATLSFLSLGISIWNIIGITPMLVCIIPMIVGVALINNNLNNRKRKKRLKQYLAYMITSNGSLDAICSHLHLPYNMVYSDINFLIESDILVNSYIDDQNREVISPIVGADLSSIPKVMYCKNCGASNEIKGNLSCCEFCGSQLSNQ